ncbi:lytic transglycosylase domain-containing protein [Geopsychrobacter electrodiphilus]|uniref:lytic transglycosylase domain-containing protein n=1 Tax=Geopsychrobacter electrodiphilus TaxID=225196 RepID=UPI0003796541|nr:lytic transglycosylase domain-containing protein [Geopsychrobacter electrodiphilus]
MFLRFWIIGWLAAYLLFSAPTRALAQKDTIPPLLESLHLEQSLTFCGEPVPLDDPDVRERLEKELLLSLWDRDQAILWLKRSTRYFPTIEAALSRAGLPDDLKYIALAESALRPHAGSAKGAIGFWQFLPETARRYGLTVNESIDQRRNLDASTRAAAAYYTELFNKFGSWSLAATAFNMGEEGLQAEILAQHVSNFYRLYLSLETQRYLFRVLSAKLILTQPERFGFHLQKSDYYPPLRFTTIDLTSYEETSLTVVAEAARTDFKRIKDLNPELRGHYLAAGTYRLALPEKTPPGFKERFQKLHAEWRQKRQERIYIVQPGDNLSTIADQFRVPLAAILIWNRIDLNSPLHPGDRLIIHQPEEPAENP